MTYERFVGLRYLTTRGRQTFISIITVISLGGVSLGVAALIIVLAVLTGFEETLKDKILGINPHILVIGYGGGMDDADDVMAEALATPGVIAATPFVYGHVMLSDDFGQAGVMLRGIDPARAGEVIQVLDGTHLEEGSLAELTPISKDRLPGILLGDAMARDLAVVPGDTITVLSHSGTLNPFMPGPSVSPFRVAGIYDSGMEEYDSQLAFVHIEEGQRLFGTKGKVSGIELRVNDPYRAEEIKADVQARLGDRPLAFRSWLTMNAPLLAAFKLEKVVYFVVVVLITLVASFNIVSTLIMVVMEKRKDIAILKTMGATATGIRRIFMVEGLVVGIGGTFLGVAGGLVTALNLPWLADRYESLCSQVTGKVCKILPDGVFYIDKVPSRVNPSEVVLVAVTAIVICLLATVLPAWQASRLDPAEALRYE